MRRLLRWLRRFVIALVIFVVAVVVTVLLVAWSRLPRTEGEARLPGLRGQVMVRRDRWGVPHIQAGNELDAWAGLGFVHAQDRFFQMDLARRAVSGRLAELVGPAALPLDRKNRRRELARLAAAQLDTLPAELRAIVEAYARGVRAGLADSGRPVECVLLGYEPEPWRPVDSLLVLKYMENLLGLDGGELERTELAERAGPAVASFLFDFQGLQGTTILPRGAARSHAAAAPLPARPRALPEGHERAEPEVFRGSNSWVLGGRRTVSGKPLLANDTHLQAAAPSIWYQARVRYPGVDVVGMTIAGSPFVVVGHNARTAWGATTLMADQVDFVRLELDTPGGRRFRGPAGWEPVTSRTERLGVQGGAPERLEVRTTRFGPIVEESGTEALARQWTAAHTSRTVLAVHAFQSARSVAALLRASRDFTSPGQNLVFADVDGHIGYRAAGAIPERTQGQGLWPVDATQPGAEWPRVRSPAELPTLLDPPSGFIVTANNQVGTDEASLAIGRWWAMPSRAERIVEAIEARPRHDLRSMQRLQVDAVAPLARRLVAALPEGPIRDADARRWWQRLRRWDARYERGPEPSVFEVLHRELRRALFEDDVGDGWMSAMPGLLKVAGAYRFDALPAEPTVAELIDDHRTPARETLPVILERALRATLRQLRARFGPDERAWDWRAAHTLVFPHPLGRVKPLDRIFSIGPVAVRGGHYAPCATAGEPEDPFAATHIPVYRMVVDLADLGASRIVNSVGQSGHRLSSHWGDQVRPWTEGRLLPMLYDLGEVRAATEGVLVLRGQ